MKKKYFKVQIGFGKDDFISITEDELPLALRAQVTGKVALFSEGSVSGNNIISITPDFNRHMGYKRGYQLVSEDYDLLGRRTVNEYRELIENTKQSVTAQLQAPGVKQLKP